MKQSGFNLIHRIDLLNMLRALYQVYAAQDNQGAMDALNAVAIMLGAPSALKSN